MPPFPSNTWLPLGDTIRRGYINKVYKEKGIPDDLN